jgi:hypothetical protein
MREGAFNMKHISLVVGLAAALLGCTVNSNAPQTAWGRKDVSMIDYRTDAGQCAVLAATHNSRADGTKQAGGIDGQNGAAPNAPAASGSNNASAAAAGNASSSTPADSGGGMYRESASSDFVNRAVMQQRNQEIAAQRARSDALKSCLTDRGYTEFELTAAQRAELDKLAQGSEARRDYLYKLGTDPEVLAKQSVTRK